MTFKEEEEANRILPKKRTRTIGELRIAPFRLMETEEAKKEELKDAEITEREEENAEITEKEDLKDAEITEKEEEEIEEENIIVAEEIMEEERKEMRDVAEEITEDTREEIDHLVKIARLVKTVPFLPPMPIRIGESEMIPPRLLRTELGESLTEIPTEEEEEAIHIAVEAGIEKKEEDSRTDRLVSLAPCPITRLSQLSLETSIIRRPKQNLPTSSSIATSKKSELRTIAKPEEEKDLPTLNLTTFRDLKKLSAIREPIFSSARF